MVFGNCRSVFALQALFYLEKEEATFLFLGTHDEVRRFMGNA
jgi:hypothetical protein